ncbi:pirin family protein [Acinetobacter junii]|uniref:Pirin-related protein n=2 Tax=Acinetobacter TaxID=469 RepID=S7WBD6_ACIJU|nr:pirin family protein [Acinetobacter junii]MBY3626988.1 pirin family protein [Acinetobacter sp. CUI P1]ENV52501.1 hypothetical protein F953_00050 [Acinetobacter junii CIP 107470 = MTCC 11364]EPR80246.1 Pirin-related protein [Acinetobacter junii CIP 107470 = MTCC 11364]MDH1003742.1 pirin family protein [Acinetobacter junii]MDH1917240.1 pirin family protein [Acinetobacter junii]
MTNTQDGELSYSEDCEKIVDSLLQEFTIRSATIGKGTVIKRALPSRHKRLVGAWCFLDHAGPVSFPAGDGLDVGPHPHIGLQTFTWMIEGTMMHTDSLGSKQLIRPKQVNLMTAGRGISHTEVAPDTETQMHAAQLWIALPDNKRNMEPNFEHYPELPVVVKDQVEFTVLVGDFLNTLSPVQVHTPLVGVDLTAQADTKTRIPLNPAFEYAFMALDGTARVNGHELTADNMVVLETGLTEIEVEIKSGNRVLLIGGEPFESPILLWWNFVGRTMEDLQQAREDWINHDARFGEIPDYQGKRLEAPTLPDQMRASK